MERIFNRDLSALSSVQELIDDFADEQQLPDTVTSALHLAIDELFTNMVKYQPHGADQIGVSLRLEEASVIVKLVDRDVEPFDLTNAKPPDLDVPWQQRQPGGLGIFLTRTIMDDVKYEYKDRTSIVTLVKNLEDKHV